MRCSGSPLPPGGWGRGAKGRRPSTDRVGGRFQIAGGIALSIRNVSKRFGRGGEAIHALDDISLEVRPGELLAVIGPSGCGKSTLFNVVGGLLEEYQGEVRVDGRPVRGPQRDMGMVFQEESTFPWLTTLENVMFPLEVAGVARAECRARARDLLRLVGLEEFAGRYPAELSGGMRQRTAIARTLAFAPRILLLDEPFGALDEQTRLLLGDKVLQIHRELGQTSLLITHSLTEAVQLADRVAVMTFRPGRIKRVVEIDLPRPRSSEIVASAEFGRLVGVLWQDLREEASRGLSESEAAAR
jgi:NitT/TauT family transport system ATP-binding protein